MGLFDYFRRKPPIRDVQSLADFIDERAAFLVQKAIYEYSRARAGHYSKVLFKEPTFHAAVEQSRWRSYPLGLVMVAEAADSVLRPKGSDQRRQHIEALADVVLSVFDRYPIPAATPQQDWLDLRADLDRRLRQIGLHPPKRAMDIPEPYAQLYFDLMPIHEKLRGRDFETTHNYLKVTLCNIHDELTNRMDAAAMAVLLNARAKPEKVGV